MIVLSNFIKKKTLAENITNQYFCISLKKYLNYISNNYNTNSELPEDNFVRTPRGKLHQLPLSSLVVQPPVLFIAKQYTYFTISVHSNRQTKP